MAIKLGVIAEDLSDVAVAEILVQKLARKSFQIKQFVGRGCGKIASKCSSWADTLEKQGCTLLLVLHDLDERNETDLARKLANSLHPSPIQRHVIVIPVKELEAWLLADHDAITRALKLKKAVGKVSNPQAVRRPKEKLRDLIYLKSEKRITYVNTIHNVKIAECLSIRNLTSRCPSFVPFSKFFTAYLR